MKVEQVTPFTHRWANGKAGWREAAEWEVNAWTVLRLEGSTPSLCTMKAYAVDVRKTECDVYVGRPSQWGNPFLIGIHGTREEVVARYAEWILSKPHLLHQLHTLKGKKLGCFCAPKLCHADVLAELAENTGT